MHLAVSPDSVKLKNIKLNYFIYFFLIINQIITLAFICRLIYTAQAHNASFVEI